MKKRRYTLPFIAALVALIVGVIVGIYLENHAPNREWSAGPGHPENDTCVLRAEELIYYLDCGYGWERANKLVDSVHTYRNPQQ